MLDKTKKREKLDIPGYGYAMWSDVTGFLVETLTDVKWESASSWVYLMSIRPDEIGKGKGGVILRRFLLEIDNSAGVIVLVAPYNGMSSTNVKAFLIKFGFIELKRDGWMVRYPAVLQEEKPKKYYKFHATEKSLGKQEKWINAEALDDAEAYLGWGEDRKAHRALQICDTESMSEEQLSRYRKLRIALVRNNASGPQERLEAGLDAMSQTGWSFGAIIDDIMEHRGLTKAADATDEQWAEYLERWMPK